MTSIGSLFGTAKACMLAIGGAPNAKLSLWIDWRRAQRLEEGFWMQMNDLSFASLELRPPERIAPHSSGGALSERVISGSHRVDANIEQPRLSQSCCEVDDIRCSLSAGLRRDGRFARMAWQSPKNLSCLADSLLAPLSGMAFADAFLFSGLQEKFMADRQEVVLSERERQCLRWIEEGKSSWAIGVILNVSENTVNFHVKNARRKLETSSRT
ncbi:MULTISPECIES: LuxR C-terminal-related transcriptional regulator [unclassified Bradyrhizobium]|uniref:helix-turn-helix transcriptional regulator n=1 Tax=unclassified Bradyrhizobium TaxID=2631580 RepID=UPI001CD57465|nr:MULTISPECIES: LuxR C-terminal-related transcriptional regulator [unclassified Bradyrhizobium]